MIPSFQDYTFTGKTIGPYLDLYPLPEWFDFYHSDQPQFLFRRKNGQAIQVMRQIKETSIIGTEKVLIPPVFQGKFVKLMEERKVDRAFLDQKIFINHPNSLSAFPNVSNEMIKRNDNSRNHTHAFHIYFSESIYPVDEKKYSHAEVLLKVLNKKTSILIDLNDYEYRLLSYPKYNLVTKALQSDSFVKQGAFLQSARYLATRFPLTSIPLLGQFVGFPTLGDQLYEEEAPSYKNRPTTTLLRERKGEGFLNDTGKVLSVEELQRQILETEERDNKKIKLEGGLKKRGLRRSNSVKRSMEKKKRKRSKGVGGKIKSPKKRSFNKRKSHYASDLIEANLRVKSKTKRLSKFEQSELKDMQWLNSI
jgi:hypothetical protein